MNAILESISMGGTVGELETRLKTLWGARWMPFGKGSETLYQTDRIKEIRNSLQQLLGVGASGLCIGPHGVGKTVLMEQILSTLPEKLFSVMKLTHSSLTASDLVRSLCYAMGVVPQMRRSDNIHQIHRHWQQRTTHSLLMVDEAQNLSASALEELRLLGCLPQKKEIHGFSLLLVGDENLLARMQMGINQSLRSRLGFCLNLPPFNAQESKTYIDCRWREVGVVVSPLEEAAYLLLHQASGGIARLINHLIQLAIAQALELHERQITTQHVQNAMTHLPWLIPLSAKNEPIDLR